MAARPLADERQGARSRTSLSGLSWPPQDPSGGLPAEKGPFISALLSPARPRSCCSDYFYISSFHPMAPEQIDSCWISLACDGRATGRYFPLPDPASARRPPPLPTATEWRNLHVAYPAAGPQSGAIAFFSDLAETYQLWARLTNFNTVRAVAFQSLQELSWPRLTSRAPR
jgi:hypothetical protein